MKKVLIVLVVVIVASIGYLFLGSCETDLGVSVSPASIISLVRTFGGSIGDGFEEVIKSCF
ncbi:MAG: hypothetical protein QM538_05680 [Methylacidiphilales bacterium]|nr:hypothetical protein [Candidatus Methylacidiphilales bacterium]